MAGGKETPRQRMIGILYLVLLGLIALDVPDNLLDSFKNIADSLTASKANVTTGINTTIKAFENSKLKDQKERATPIYERAIKARNLADAFDKYVDSIKTILIKNAGGIDPVTQDYKGRDDMDVSFHLLVNEGKGEGYTLHKKIDALREGLMASLKDDRERAGIDLPLHPDAPRPVSGQPKKDWEAANFGEGIPMAAAMTALVKLQSDAKNAENEIIKKILIEADQTSVNLDKFEATAVAPTSYILVGHPYTADVFLTAYDSQKSPTITVNGSPIQVVQGKGKYVGSTATEGLHTWTGTISFKDNNGEIKTYQTQPQTYFVTKPSAVVSADKMNVMYIGLPNPLSVSAPGSNLKDLTVTISNGKLTGGDGHYVATLATPTDVVVTVSGQVGKGKTEVLGTSKFRVKRLPDPKPVFAGKSGGDVTAVNIRSQDALYAVLKDFDFDAKFTITHFNLNVQKPRQDIVTYLATTGQLTAQMKTILSNITPGSLIEFSNIAAVGPDGAQRGLDPIIIHVK